jgi:dienelactone hydrolase
MRHSVILLLLALTAMCGGALPPPGPETAQLVTTGFIQNGEVRLSYQIDRPQGAGPFPAVVIGHGSGQTTKPACRFLANRMIQRGYATLCYDKRGVGESTGTYVNVGTFDSERVFPDLASDMVAAVRHLRSLAGIDRNKIGLMGNSQAGWIIPEAAQHASPAFMIMVVGPTVSVGEEMFYSRLTEGTSTPLDEVYPKLVEFTGPRGYDPRPVLERLNVPGLWLLGGQDRSIPTPRTVRILDALVAAGRPYAYHVYPAAGHDLGTMVYWADVDSWLARVVR